MNVVEARQRLEQLKGRRIQLQQDVANKEAEVRSLEARGRDAEEGLVVVRQVERKTQEALEYRVSELCTLAMRSIFPRPYQMHLDFTLRRNQTEADITFSRNDGVRISPRDASGGSVTDLAAMALRLSMWSLRKPRSRNSILMDEPMRCLDRTLPEKTGELLREIQNNMKVQFIIISHEEQMWRQGDRIFNIEMGDDEVSRVSEV